MSRTKRAKAPAVRVAPPTRLLGVDLTTRIEYQGRHVPLFLEVYRGRAPTVRDPLGAPQYVVRAVGPAVIVAGGRVTRLAGADRSAPVPVRGDHVKDGPGSLGGVQPWVSEADAMELALELRARLTKFLDEREPLEVGDVVAPRGLASKTSFRMTVAAITSGTPRNVTCQWFEGKGLRGGDFDETDLERAKPVPQPPDAVAPPPPPGDRRRSARLAFLESRKAYDDERTQFGALVEDLVSAAADLGIPLDDVVAAVRHARYSP